MYTYLKKNTKTTVVKGLYFYFFPNHVLFHSVFLMCFQAAMVVLTRTPSVKVGFLKEPNLHCLFAVDHKLPHATVEWRLQRHGERSKLFSYSSRTGKTEGSGVAVKAIAAGNASIKLPPTRKHSEGTYICSVMVPPLNGSHDIPLTISGEMIILFNSIEFLSASEISGDKCCLGNPLTFFAWIKTANTFF